MFVQSAPLAEDSDYAVAVRAHRGDAKAVLEANRRGLARSAAKQIEVAGVAIKAADTGRILMIQRSNKDESDPARGTWEAPGGHVDEGESPWDAAKREWQEETGAPWPDGKLVGNWISGPIYQGFVYVVPTEDSVQINLSHEDREALNPDDPDGDDIEVASWWEIKHLKDNPAVRKEFKRGTDFELLKKAK